MNSSSEYYFSINFPKLRINWFIIKTKSFQFLQNAHYGTHTFVSDFSSPARLLMPLVSSSKKESNATWPVGRAADRAPESARSSWQDMVPPAAALSSADSVGKSNSTPANKYHYSVNKPLTPSGVWGRLYRLYDYFLYIRARKATIAFSSDIIQITQRKFIWKWQSIVRT